MISRYRNLLSLAIALLLQLFLLAYQLRRNRDVPLVRYAAVLVVTPFQKALYVTVNDTEKVWRNYLDLRGVRRENEALHHQLDSLKLETSRLQEQAAEFRSLQALLDLRRQLPSATAVAQVIGASSSDTARMITIDKGATGGLRPDMPVLAPDGVVGKVLHVFPGVSQVLLLTDPYSGVACLLEDSRVHGVLKGLNKPLCSLDYVSNGDQVKPGQKVLTSGEDQIYPKGLPVGIVVDARPGPEFQQISVRPLAELGRIEQVLVLLTPPGEQVAETEGPEGPPAPGNKGMATAAAAPKASPPAPASAATPSASVAAAAAAPALSKPAPAVSSAPPPPALAPAVTRQPSVSRKEIPAPAPPSQTSPDGAAQPGSANP